MAHAREIQQGERFAFGDNWSRFLSQLDNERILEAETSLKAMLGVESLAGKSFLDINSGSGLFSLAARRLGARVHSVDQEYMKIRGFTLTTGKANSSLGCHEMVFTRHVTSPT